MLICKITVQGVDRMIGMFIDELDKGYTYTEESIDLAKVCLSMLKTWLKMHFAQSMLTKIELSNNQIKN